MSPSLTLSGDFNQPDLDSLCDELQGLLTWSGEEPVHIDLRGLENLDPIPLAVLLTSLGGLCNRQVWDPLGDAESLDETPRLECLHPQRLKNLLVGGDGHWEKRDDESTILGCECFAGLDGVDRVTRSLYRQLAIHTDWSTPSLKSMNGMIFELSENVIQHSKTTGGIAVLRICPGDQQISLAIADHGIGIRESLARNPEYSDMEDDLAAISKAMGPRTTGEPGTGGGMGLFLARCLVRSNGGNFMVRSGEACREENDCRIDLERLPTLHGTLVSVEARTDLPFEYDQSVETMLHQYEAAAD